MKDSIAYAKNETFELILGNVLIGLGGVLIGMVSIDPSLINLMVPSFISFGLGIFFDVRVLLKFSKELSSTKAIIKDMHDKTFKFISSARSFRPLEGTLEDLQRRLSDLERKFDDITYRTRGY